MTNITLPLVIGSAVIDSINPCAFAVLIFLIVYLLALKDKQKMLQIGLIYIFMVFAVYFAAGLGLLSFVQSVQITHYLYYFASVLAVVLGLINIVDAIWIKSDKPFLAIPESKKPLIEKYIKKASLPSAVILGILVAAFELPCTGGVYLAILSLLADKHNLAVGVFYLFIYNLIFILPLLLILLAARAGLDPRKMENLRKERKALMRAFIGFLLLALGV